MRRWLAVSTFAIGLFLVTITVRAKILRIDLLHNAPWSPVVRQPAQAPADGWVPYGTTYVWSSNFSDLEGLKARLQYVHSLGLRTLIQMHNPNAPLTERRRFLDEAHALGLRVIVRLSGADSSSPPWGWNGEHFDLTPLETFLSGDGIADHPALLAIYGFHVPWDDFTAAEIRQFYTEFHTAAPDIPLYHDLVWVEEPPYSDFSAGMCDLCEVSSMPHMWLADDTPFNNERHVTEKIVRYTSRVRQADPNAQIWIQAQAFQQQPNFRMPTAQDMIWHAETLMEHVDFDGLLWYSYLHSYEHQLGDDGMEAQRQAVHTVYSTYYAGYPTPTPSPTPWSPTDWVYLPLVRK
ncbi:MAG: hypothetical protein SWK90_10975 [Chloroflexota bacterium]|nr:hypothetical protein [Chloroflexota bacterium]